MSNAKGVKTPMTIDQRLTTHPVKDVQLAVLLEPCNIPGLQDQK